MSKKKTAIKPAQTSSAPLKSLAFAIAFLVLIALVLIALEGLLNLFGAGVPTKPFRQVETFPGVYVDDGAGFKKYYPRFSSAGASDPIRQNIFQMPKASDVRRGFVLGESTAQGFPFLKNQSWGKLVEVALETAPSGIDWEILNVGRAAMSSYYLRDLAPKLLEYDPDFLVVYAGHNDYYGTISQSTGSSHFLRNLYLGLKEYRLFQLLFEAFSPVPPRAEGTRMAQQFADRLLPADEAQDREVAAHFIDNLETSVRPFLERRIPVIVFEPVSNLGMPPFAGADPGHESDLKAWSDALEAKSAPRARELSLLYSRPDYADEAAFVHLAARTAALETGAWPEELLIRAKDLDKSPFRARSALVDALRAWAAETEKRFPRFVYVKTGESLKAAYGQEAFTGRLFIDHLHFNFEGQRALATLACGALDRLFALGSQAAAAYELLTDDRQCRQAVSLTDLFDYRALRGVEKLLRFPPYSTMALAPDFGLAKLQGSNGIYQDPELRMALDAAAEEDLFSVAMSYYGRKKLIQNQVENLFAMNWVNPGAAESHLWIGDYFAGQSGTRAQAADAYKKAYYLSGLKPDLKAKWDAMKTN